MLTALEIENFKGIAARQRIDFAPLTLLFGANSAGKSTILQALLYLHELIERGSADVDRTELGGNVIELGGFARLVHQHDTDRAIVLRAEFTTPGGLERFERGLVDLPFPDLDDDVVSAWLELTVRFRESPSYRGPLVERAVIGVNDVSEPLVWLDLGASIRDGEPVLARVNLGHPILATELLEVQSADSNATAASGQSFTAEIPASVVEDWQRIAIPEQTHAAIAYKERADEDPDSRNTAASEQHDEPLSLVFAVKRNRLSALLALDAPIRVIPFGDVADENLPLAAEAFRKAALQSDEQCGLGIRATLVTKSTIALGVEAFLESIVLGTTTQLATFLRDARYVGPLRTIPPRGSLYERAGRPRSWADGLAAWDLLLADRLTLVEQTNAWLRKLNVGSKVVVQQLFEGGADAEDVAAGHVDKTVRRLLLDTGVGSFVLPSEVGAGISQLIPVLVAAIEGRGGLTLVEQPEIHVHPAVQVGLGDLLLEAANRERQRRIILVETHSEHLLLRIMRRMRETHEGTAPEGLRPVRPGDVSLVFVEKDGARSISRRMPLNERGELVKAWPGGFFEEGLREVL